jgi:hypothetical protein
MSRAATISRGRFASDKRAILIAWIAALAIAFQCIVVQSHIHIGVTPAWAHQASTDLGAIAVSDNSLAAEQSDDGTRHAPTPADPAGCFICQQMAMAGAAVLPATPAPIVIQLASIVHAVMAEVAAPRTRASHDWRSRAPPIRL